MDARVIKTSFTSGEWAPSLYARVDISQYSDGAKRIENAFIHAHGGVSNRTGTTFVDAQPASAGEGTIRLIPFQFSVVQTYVLEFSDYKMRVIKDGGMVLDVNDDIYEMATPYPEGKLHELKFTQSADKLYLTHEDFPPKVIDRFDHDDWTITDIAFASGVGQATIDAISSNLGSGSKVLAYKIAKVDIHGEEGEPSAEKTRAWDGKWLVTHYLKVQFTGEADADSYNVYKNQNGYFGFVGRVVTEGSTGSFTFTDDNILPKGDDGPQSSRNPFDGISKYPAAVAIYHQRMIFGRSNSQPQTTWLSQTGRLSNFNVSHPLKDDDAIEATMASHQVNEIKFYKAIQELIVFTTGGVWKLSGAGDQALSPTSIDFQIQEHYGVANIEPVAIGSAILYVQRGGRVVRELAYSLEQDSYDSGEASILSNHLFEGRRIIRWACQQNPETVIWCVMSDGSLLTLTYNSKQKVKAWARHSTDGKFQDVAIITSDRQDEVYFVVERETADGRKRYIEKLVDRQEQMDIEDCCYLDCSLSLDESTEIDDIIPRVNDNVLISSTAHGLTSGDYVDVRGIKGGAYEAINDMTLSVSVLDDDHFKLLNRYTSIPIAVAGDPNDLISKGEWSLAVNSVSGLDHLEGRTVSVLANGNVIEDLVVTNGTISIGETSGQASSKIHVGLKYETVIETLPVEIAAGSDTLQGKTQRISEVTLRLDNTRGVFVGGSEDDLTEVKFRKYESYDEATRLFTGDKNVAIHPRWKNTGGVVIKQKYPLPMTILAVTPSISVGEK